MLLTLIIAACIGLFAALTYRPARMACTLDDYCPDCGRCDCGRCDACVCGFTD